MNQHLRHQGECDINEAIAEFLTICGLNEGFARMQIEAIWKETIGKAIAKYTKKVELNGSKLTLYITSPTVKNELLMLKTDIIKQLNNRIGKELIKEVIII